MIEQLNDDKEELELKLLLEMKNVTTTFVNYLEVYKIKNTLIIRSKISSLRQTLIPQTLQGRRFWEM